MRGSTNHAMSSLPRKAKNNKHQRRQLHPVIGRTYAAARANGLLRQNLQSAMLAIHSDPLFSPEKTPLPNARTVRARLAKIYWSEEQSRDSYGETCAGCTLVALGVNSKCNSHWLSSLRPFTSGAENCQRLAALDCLVGKVLAACRRVELGRVHRSRGVHPQTQGEPHRALNRRSRFFRNVRQDLLQNFPLCGGVSIGFRRWLGDGGWSWGDRLRCFHK